MSQDKLTVSSKPPVTLDSLFMAMQAWRDNKAAYPDRGIPENIWEMIFQLEDAGYLAKELRRICGINSTQYTKKRTQLRPSKKVSTPNSDQTLTKTSADPKLKAEQASIDAKPFVEAVVVSEEPSDVPPLKEASDQTKQAIRRLKSTDTDHEKYLDPTTIIVECIRPDGHRLKIHTTDARLDIVMRTFHRGDLAS